MIDHEAEHGSRPALGEVARLDTCVTVVDAAQFHSNLGSLKTEIQGTIAQLLLEQVEFSNVVVLNKEASQNLSVIVVSQVYLTNSILRGWKAFAFTIAQGARGLLCLQSGRKSSIASWAPPRRSLRGSIGRRGCGGGMYRPVGKGGSWADTCDITLPYQHVYLYIHI